MAGEQEAEEFDPTPRGIKRHCLRLASVLLADRGENPVVVSRQRAQGRLDLSRAGAGLNRLLKKRIRKKCVTGVVASNDSVETNAVAGRQPSLRSHCGRNRTGFGVRRGNRFQAVVERRG